MTFWDCRLSASRGPLTALLCAAVLGQSSPLEAQTDDENARRHFESGAVYLQQSDNENALREFQAAYTLSKRPALLLNIANVYERMGKPKEAVETLTKYLANDPQTPERTTIETRIANLKKRAEEAAPAASASAAPAPVTSAAPATSAAPVASASAPLAPPVEAPRSTPGPNRTGAYVVLGAGAAAGIGAIVTGIIAKSKYDSAKSNCAPGCPNSEVDPIKSTALVSDILTGVAAAGIGVGAVLFFTAKSPAEGTGLRPSVGGTAGPRGGKVEATWRF